MNRHIILPHVQIPDVVKGNPYHFAAQLQIQAPFLPLPLFQRPVQHREQLFPADGLHQIVQRRHLVALGDIVGIPGDEDDLHRLVVFAHPFCQTYAVHSAHFDVQQQNVPVLVLRVPEQEALGGGKGGNFRLMPGLRRPILYQTGNIRPIFLRVVADRDP